MSNNPFIRLVRPATNWQSAYDQWYFQNFGIVDGWHKELAAADYKLYAQGTPPRTATREELHNAMFPKHTIVEPPGKEPPGKEPTNVEHEEDLLSQNFAKVILDGCGAEASKKSS